MRCLNYLIIGFLLVLAAANEGSAQTYRNAVSVPPVQVYEAMLKFADAKKYEKVFLSLRVLNPILNHIKAQLSVNPAKGIQEAILAGERDQVRLSIHRMIYLDIKDLTHQAESAVREASGKPKPLIRTAWMNYVLLIPYIKKTDFVMNRNIRKSFESAFRLMGKGSIYSTEESSLDVNAVVSQLSAIRVQMDAVFSQP